MTQSDTQTQGYPALLTLLQADLYAREVVAEAGAFFMYERKPHPTLPNAKGCVYVHEGKPDCIVARVLARHGVPVSELKRWEDIAAGDMGPMNGRVVTTLRSEVGGALMTGEAASFLGNLQAHQDGGTAWGFALESAERNDFHRALREDR